LTAEESIGSLVGLFILFAIFGFVGWIVTTIFNKFKDLTDNVINGKYQKNEESKRDDHQAARRLEAERIARIVDEAAKIKAAGNQAARRLEAERIARISAEESAKIKATKAAKDIAKVTKNAARRLEIVTLNAERISAEESARIERLTRAQKQTIKSQNHAVSKNVTRRLESERISAEESAKIKAAKDEKKIRDARISVNIANQEKLNSQGLQSLNKESEDFHQRYTKLARDRENAAQEVTIRRNIENVNFEKLNKNTLLLKKILDNARNHHENKRYAQAIDEYTRLIDLDPDNYIYFEERGKSYNLNKDFLNASEDYEKSLILQSIEYIDLDIILSTLESEHREVLQWSFAKSGEIIAHSVLSEDTSSPETFRKFIKLQKGIYKPAARPYSIGVKQVISRKYEDKSPYYRKDGTWSYEYYQERSSVTNEADAYTNDGLRICMEDRIPVCVLIQVSKSPSYYKIMGIGMISGFFEERFLIEGFSNDRKARLLTS